MYRQTFPDWHPKTILQRHREEKCRKGLLAPTLADIYSYSDNGEISDDEVIAAIRSVPKHKGAKTYWVHNSAGATTAAPVVQPTGTAIRTMMQLAPATGYPGRIVAWGFSFDGSAAATPGKVELFGTTVAATGLSTAYAVADIQPYNDPNAPANTSGTSGVPLNLGTSLSGFATASVTEGTVANYRAADLCLAPPTAPYVRDWPLGREFEFAAGTFIRVRVTFGTTVNMYAWVVLEF